MQRCRVPGYHRLGREQGTTAKNRDSNYACIGLISAPRTMNLKDSYSLVVFLQSNWPDTHSRTAPRGCKFVRVGTIRTSLSSPLESKYSTRYSESSYKKPNTSRYAQGIRCTDGVSLTQEEHYSIGMLRFFIIHALLLLCLSLIHI